MSAPAHRTPPVSTALPRWPRQRAARIARALIRRIALYPIVGLVCRPLIVCGSAPDGPVVFAANHSSHADAATLLRALPRRVRARTAFAAAEDYFYRGRARAALVSLGMGAFPFPRRGTAGLERARALIAEGWNVVLFPEGSRSIDGRIGRFKAGIGSLAREGVTVVPVGIAGTRDVLPKGRRLPMRAPVAVTFGSPIRVPYRSTDDATRHVERSVRALAAGAALSRPVASASVYARVRAFARSPRALLLLLCWGFAEALVFPIVPDVGIVLLSVAAPMRLPAFAAASIAGSIGGGAVAYALGPGSVEHLPLVTERMGVAAADWLAAEGPRAVWHQPWSGVPFKAFAFQAASSDVSVAPMLWHTLLARGLRFVEVGGVFAVLGLGAQVRIARRRLGDLLYAPFVSMAVLAFALGLARVVAVWS